MAEPLDLYMILRASDKLSAPPQLIRALDPASALPLIVSAACAILPKLNEIMAATNCCLVNGKCFILPPAVAMLLISESVTY